ncbi:MAG: preprotein translocase subunit YajC [Bdellovibrionales bacterium]|nr:preprotein translocase subunit YajC [Bdellovibrionales bacterium]
MLPMFVIVFFIFYFLVLRPQEKRMKEHEKLMTDLKRGDEVVTTSGFLGRVVGVDEECVTVELANNVRVRVLRNFISSKVDRSSATGEKKKAAS